MGSVSRSSRLSALSAGGKQLFLAAVKSPLASNVLLGLILTGLEKAVEVEFACPCDPTWNKLFASAFFTVPALVASALMLLIQGCKCKVHEEDKEKFALFGLVPAIMWLVLTFLDGQYYVCAMTNWTGRFVIVDKAEPQRWCEPTNRTSYMERMILTQRWYFHSQFVGVGIALGCLVLFGAYQGCRMLCKKKTEETEKQSEKPNNDECKKLKEEVKNEC